MTKSILTIKNIAMIIAMVFVLFVFAACDESDRYLNLDSDFESLTSQTVADETVSDKETSFEQITKATEQTTFFESTELETTETETEAFETGFNDLVIGDLMFDDRKTATVGSVRLRLSNDGSEFMAIQALSEFADVVIPSSVNSVPITRIGGEAFKGAAFTSIVIPKSVVYIDVCAFGSSNRMFTVYYEGTEEEWSRVNINNDYNANKALNSATKYFYSDTEPTSDGNYWHYVDGVPTKW